MWSRKDLGSLSPDSVGQTCWDKRERRVAGDPASAPPQGHVPATPVGLSFSTCT